MTLLASERVIINAPMSFAGAYQRTTRLNHAEPGWKRWTVWLLLVNVLAVWWAAVIVWYTVTIGLFGIVTVPYRLLRRGARKRKAEALRHRETLAALETRKP